MWGRWTVLALVCSALFDLVEAFGLRQSPIDLPPHLRPFSNENGKLMQIRFGSAPATLLNKNQTIQADWTGGPTSHLVLEGVTYKALQLHFHAGSEHRINGHQFPIEMHIVHQSVTDSGQLAVLGLFFDVSTRPNPFLDEFFPHLQHPNVPSSIQIKQIRGHLLHIKPKQHIYRYHGSLTTGTFSENVEWAILATPQPISKLQLDAYMRHFPLSTSRAPQPLHDRIVKLVAF